MVCLGILAPIESRVMGGGRFSYREMGRRFCCGRDLGIYVVSAFAVLSPREASITELVVC